MPKMIPKLNGLLPNSDPGLSHQSRVERALDTQASAVLAPGKLSTKDKLLLLVATCCARRHYGPVREVVRLALRWGASIPEVEEVLLVCYVSRGPLVYLEARKVLGTLLKEKRRRKVGESLLPSGTLSDTLKKFRSYFGTMSLWTKS